jgi:hypothetical protein
MQKYGFVYLWYDRKHKKYYVGCRWGTENDGYICSSQWMKQGYFYRPQDFKRRILARIYTSKKDLLNEEYRWLSLIKDEELGKRYYNLNNHHFGHWTTNPDTRSTREKISQTKTGVKTTMTPEQLAERGRQISESKAKRKADRLALGLPVRKTPSTPPQKGRKQSDEEKAKRSESLKKAWEEGRNKGTTGKTIEWSEERRQKHKESVQGCHDDRNPEAYSKSAKDAWASGKFKNRRSNNMKDFIWVRRKSDGSRTRIKQDTFDDLLHIRGR